MYSMTSNIIKGVFQEKNVLNPDLINILLEKYKSQKLKIQKIFQKQVLFANLMEQKILHFFLTTIYLTALNANDKYIQK